MSPGERIDMWLKCGMVKQAIDEAGKAKDRKALEELKTKASGTLVDDINRMLDQLKKGR